MRHRFRRLALLAGMACLAARAGAQAPPSGPCETQLKRWRELAAFPVAWKLRDIAAVQDGSASDLNDSDWETAVTGKRLERDALWLRTTFVVPTTSGGYLLQGARLELETSLYVHWQTRDMPVYTTVFVNGMQRASGYEFEPVVLTEAAAPGEKFIIAVRAQTSAGKLMIGNGRIRVTEARHRPNAQLALEELASAEMLLRAEPENAQRRTQVEAACAAVNWEALPQGDQAAFDASLGAARAKLEPLRDWIKSFQVTAVGNSHIDMAWLWPWTETVEVVRNTFSSALTLMQEFPELHFSHGAAATYFWMEDKYPELFAAIQKRAREGRWEFVGGMWVEPDLNMPDGESLARQLLVGKRYIKEKFGADVRIGYNPDSFGYNWQLPQIYKKSGIEYFVTQKMAWNDTTQHPHKLFWWESPDGSRVLTFFPNDYVNSLEPIKMARDVGNYARQTHIPQLLHLFGVGDHGGGPTRHMMQVGRNWQRPETLFPTVRIGSIQQFFDGIAPLLPAANVPVWRNELYFQYHRGVQTTQANTKRNNRRSETAMLNAEKFSAFAWLGGSPYSNQEMEGAWRKLLFNQFHDILPGSGIDVVYRDASRDHAEVQRFAADKSREAIAGIARNLDTSGAGTPILVANPLGWRRSGLVEVDVPFSARSVLVSGPGRKDHAAAQVVSRGAAWTRIRFQAPDIAPMGVSVFHAYPSTVFIPKIATSLVAQAGQIENEFVRVRVDGKTGCITSLWDKRSSRESLAPGACGNLLQAFRDKPRDWEAWNIDADFEKERWDITDAEEVNLVESGPLRAVIRVRRKWRSSAFAQDVTVTAGSPRVDVRMTVDWHEDQTLLKVAFPVNAKADKATFEIPYGSIQRPTTRRTPEEQAQFEVPALRWADLSDSSGGLSLLNDSKYGYDAKDNVLRLTLLRSPRWPDPAADRGHHEFTYSLLPHAGGWLEAQTVRHGYELNDPLSATVTWSHPGALGTRHSFVKTASENVVITAVKKAEDSDDLIVRFYEFAGKTGDVALEFGSAVAAAVEANLLEQPGTPLQVSGARVAVPTRAFEIKTVRITPGLRQSPVAAAPR